MSFCMSVCVCELPYNKRALRLCSTNYNPLNSQPVCGTYPVSEIFFIPNSSSTNTPMSAACWNVWSTVPQLVPLFWVVSLLALSLPAASASFETKRTHRLVPNHPALPFLTANHCFFFCISSSFGTDPQRSSSRHAGSISQTLSTVPPSPSRDCLTSSLPVNDFDLALCLSTVFVLAWECVCVCVCVRQCN